MVTVRDLTRLAFALVLLSLFASEGFACPWSGIVTNLSDPKNRQFVVAGFRGWVELAESAVRSPSPAEDI